MSDIFRGQIPANVGSIVDECGLVRMSWNCPDVRHPLCHTLNKITTIFQASIEPMFMSVSVEAGAIAIVSAVKTENGVALSLFVLSGATLCRPSWFPSVAWSPSVR